MADSRLALALIIHELYQLFPMEASAFIGKVPFN